DNPIKPAHVIRPGDEIRIKSGPYLQRITVLALAKNRGNAQAAALLYREYPASIEQRRLLAEQLQANQALYPQRQGKPTKRERRKLSEFKNRLA
ncbi:MAG: RNA-binding protein, partial [Gammaproteobacteria bacterium]|nr:RNA-binding protein [Gammaproteobacteria bacterium]